MSQTQDRQEQRLGILKKFFTPSWENMNPEQRAEVMRLAAEPSIIADLDKIIDLHEEAANEVLKPVNDLLAGFGVGKFVAELSF